ncbi:DUF5047 domain-containing protein [Prauserella flavalba]|uniref:DUF5047 domain-containing protein n=1 Tax=Prauserella flavalba TaxID=1477506 RepID=UPI0036E77B9C
MRPVSERFLRSVRGSHQMCARARIVDPGQTGVDPDGVEIPILGGDVQLDASAEIRATLSLNTEPVWWPTGTDGLAPYGNELFVERGIVYGDGAREWVSQGYFRIETDQQRQAPRGEISISASDRMAGIIDARLLSPIQFGQGTSVRDVFEYLVQEVYPNAQLVFDFDADDTTFAGSHIAEENRYAFLLDVAKSLGKVMFWDHEGKLRVETAPDPTSPVFEVNHGEGGVLVELARTLTRNGVYNAVVATGETPGETDPVRAVAWDDNPASPTYWFGPFGRVPRFYSSPFITTQQQARDAAAAMLGRAIGLPYSVDLTAVPNPALEPLDPVRVTYSDRARAEVHVLETLTVPLLAESAMSAATREQTSITIGVQ